MNAAIAAIYVVLTLVSAPIAFEAIQFRIAEMLMLLVFFRKDYSIGLILGCFLANLIMSPIPLDWLIGTFATAIACVGMMFCKHLVVAMLLPVISNAVIVGLELTYLFELPTPLYENMLWVGLGELAVMVVGYIIFLIIFKRKKLLEFFQANQNLDWKF